MEGTPSLVNSQQSLSIGGEMKNLKVMFLAPLLVLAAHSVVGEDNSEFGPPLENSILGGISRFGRPISSGGPFSVSRLNNGQDWADIWTSTGTVPEVLPEVPENPIFVSFPSGIYIRPNDTVTSGLILQKPQVEWDARAGALYTLIMVDVDLGSNAPSPQFIHYVVTNIPGSDVSRGDTVVGYLPSFTFDFDPQRGMLLENSDLTHRYLWLVYEQKEPLNLPTETSFCSPAALVGRATTLTALTEENNLGSPYAGNFHRNKFSGDITKKFICFTSRCVGQPFPVPIAGVNDKPECQA